MAIFLNLCLVFVLATQVFAGDTESIHQPLKMFVDGLQTKSAAVRIKNRPAGTAPIGAALAMSIDVTAPGYLGVAAISNDGSIRYVAGASLVEPGTLSLWEALGEDPILALGPAGHLLLLVFHDTKERLLVGTADRVSIGSRDLAYVDKLAHLQSRLRQTGVSAAWYVVQTFDPTDQTIGAGGLAPKSTAGKPIWIPGVQGFGSKPE